MVASGGIYICIDDSYIFTCEKVLMTQKFKLRLFYSALFLFQTTNLRGRE